MHPADWYAEQDVDLRTRHAGTAHRPRPRTRSRLADGERIGYDEAAAGHRFDTAPLDVPGADLDGVLPADARRQRPVAAALRRGARVVIVGAGWIGLEVAAAARAARRRGHRRGAGRRCRCCAVLGPRDGRGVRRPAPSSTGWTCAARVTVAAPCGCRRRAARRRHRLPADARRRRHRRDARTSTSPSAAGLAVDNGVVVDEHLRSSDPDIWPRATSPTPTTRSLGTHVRVEHWANALHQPAVAARAMLGQDAVYDRLPYFFTDQYDLGMEYTGYVRPGGYERRRAGRLDRGSSSRSGCRTGGSWPA